MEKDYASEAAKQDHKTITFTKARCCCGRSWPGPRITFYLSLAMNIVLLGLFVVVFIRLDSVQTQISRMELVRTNSDGPSATKQGTHAVGSENKSSSTRPNATTSPTSSDLIVPSTLLKVRRLVSRKYVRET